MEIPFELPLDAGGFLRRECPNCAREFKWHHGKTEEAPASFVYPAVYWCPLCGESAGHDSWWTQAQLDFGQGIAINEALQKIDEGLKGLTKGNRNSMIKFTVKSSGSGPDTPDPMVEPDDMIIVAPPCHEWEPVKVPEGTQSPLHCLVCGAQYSV